MDKLAASKLVLGAHIAGAVGAANAIFGPQPIPPPPMSIRKSRKARNKKEKASRKANRK